MKIVYFPDTTIAPRQAQMLAALWGPVTLLQPSPDSCLPETKALLEKGLLETLMPPAVCGGSVQDVMGDFKQWAAQHSGDDLASMMEQGQGIPFFSSQSSAQIVAEIRKGGDLPERTPDDRPDQRIFQAQLLLAMAQEFDLQQRELARDMAALAHKEKEMMVLLKGEAGGEAERAASGGMRPSAGSDPTLSLRLKAWARVIQTVPEWASTFGASEVLFLTDRRSVLEHIREVLPETQIRLWGDRLVAGSLSPRKTDSIPGWLMDSLWSEPHREVVLSTDAVFDLVEIPQVAAETFPLLLADRLDRTDTALSASAEDASCWVGCLTMPDDGPGNALCPDGLWSK